MVQKGLFSIQNIYLPFVSLLFVPKRLNKEQTMKEFQIFDLNHGLTSLKISNIVDYLKSTFLQFRKVSIHAEAYNITIFVDYLKSIFLQSIVTRYIGKMITIIKSQKQLEIPITGIFTRSQPRKFVSLSNLLDIRRMFIWRERPVSRELHFKFRRIWFTANMLLKLSSVSYSQLPFSLSLQRLKFLQDSQNKGLNFNELIYQDQN